MKTTWNLIQFIFTAIGGWLGWFLGGVDGLIYALIGFVTADYITGLMCAIADKKLSSAVGFKGICKKVLIFGYVGLANILDVYIIKTASNSPYGERSAIMRNEEIDKLRFQGYGYKKIAPLSPVF